MTLPTLERFDVLADTGTELAFLAFFRDGESVYSDSFSIFHRGGKSKPFDKGLRIEVAYHLARIALDFIRHSRGGDEAEIERVGRTASKAAYARAAELQPDYFAQ
jgi:hypothetical protein